MWISTAQCLDTAVEPAASAMPGALSASSGVIVGGQDEYSTGHTKAVNAGDTKTGGPTTDAQHVLGGGSGSIIGAGVSAASVSPSAAADSSDAVIDLAVLDARHRNASRK